jgi:DNA-binding NarL/FixJ family response regulator
MDSEIQIVIADDHPIFRSGLRGIIETEAGMKVIGEAENGETALTNICQYEPDIAILDLDMPGKDGFAVARAIEERNLAVDVIFLTMHNSESIFNAALNLGVKGYVLKDSAMPEIIDCIKAVVKGKKYVSPQLSSLLINRRSRANNFLQDKPALSDLTPAENQILNLIAAEKTSRQIADELFISIRTVDRHRANICLKLNLRGTNALVKFAVVHKSELNSSNFSKRP